MDLKQRIQEDMKIAMRAKDTARLGVIRMLLAAIKQREVDERIILTDQQTIAVINKMLKQRQESCVQFKAGGRQDLVAKETFEIELLKAYLPQSLSAPEVDQLIISAIKEANAVSIRDMGKVMAIIKNKAEGRVEMSEISEKIKALLAT